MHGCDLYLTLISETTLGKPGASMQLRDEGALRGAQQAKAHPHDPGLGGERGGRSDAAAPLHGNETRVWGNQAYCGQKDATREAARRTRDFTNQGYRRGGRVDEAIKARNRKSRVRAKVEHAIEVIKRVGFQKVRYRGLAKNLHRLEVSAALANLFMMRRRLLNA